MSWVLYQIEKHVAANYVLFLFCLGLLFLTQEDIHNLLRLTGYTTLEVFLCNKKKGAFAGTNSFRCPGKHG